MEQPTTTVARPKPVRPCPPGWKFTAYVIVHWASAIVLGAAIGGYLPVAALWLAAAF